MDNYRDRILACIKRSVIPAKAGIQSDQVEVTAYSIKPMVDCSRCAPGHGEGELTSAERESTVVELFIFIFICQSKQEITHRF